MIARFEVYTSFRHTRVFIDQNLLYNILAKLLFCIYIRLMSSEKQTKFKEQKYRRSHRIIKKADRNTFLKHHTEHPRRNLDFKKISDTEHALETNQFFLKLMNSDITNCFSELISEMGSAFLHQREKLQNLFKINLQLSKSEELEAIQNRSEVINWKDQGTFQQYPQKYQFQSQDCFHPHSLPQSPYQWSQESNTNNNHIQRRESMCLFSDNYEKNELIYSVQTLVPRIVRDDVDPLLIGHIY